MWSELRYQHLATTMSKVGDEFKKIQQEAKDIKTSMKVTKTGEFLKKKASTSGHHCLIEDIGYVSYPMCLCHHFICLFLVPTSLLLQKSGGEFERLVIMAEQDLATGFDVEGKIYQTELRQIMGTLQSKDPSITESDKIRLLLLFVQKKATGKLLVQCSTESCQVPLGILQTFSVTLPATRPTQILF